MATWGELPRGRALRAEPPRPGASPIWVEVPGGAAEIAEAGARLLAAEDVAYLATVSPRGSPRIHPIVPAIADGRLWAFIMARSPKRADLDRNGRYALHTALADADEEFSVAGRARIHTEPEVRAVAAAAMPYDDVDEFHLLYELDVERALWTRWESFQQPGMHPVFYRWVAPDLTRVPGELPGDAAAAQRPGEQ